MRLSIRRDDGTVNAVPSWENSAEPWPDHEGMIYAYGQVHENEHWMHMPGLASFRLSSHGDDIAVAVTNSETDELLLDAYRRRVLPMAVQVRGREVLHASAIHGPAGIVTFCGTTQSGKSTIAFGLSQRGYPLWADDMVAFEISNGGAVGVSLPFRPRLRKSAAELVALDATVQTLPRHDDPPAGSHQAPLAIVCILRKDAAAASPVALRRLSSANAFATVLDHAFFFLPQAAERKRLMVRHYLELVAVTPIYEVCFQPGLTSFPLILDAVEKLLNSPAQ